MVVLGALLLPAGQAFASVGLTHDVMPNGNQIGESLSELEDLDGDGTWELLVGQPGFPNSPDNRGRVSLWFGGTNVSLEPDLTWNGEALGDHFGWSVARVGDINADGRPDWVVGAPNSNQGGTNRGKIYIYYGSSNPASITPVGIVGEQGNDRFGYSVSAAGDFDHDGVADLIVGAPNAANNRGAAYVIYGKSGGVSTDLADATRLVGEINGDLFGFDVTDAGNFFGGNFKDCVAVGAPGNSNNFGLDSGAAYVYQGGLIPDAVADLTIGISGGNPANSQFGFSIEGVGQWNNDSFDDLVIGGPFNNSGAAAAGRVDLHFGGLAPSGAADRSVRGERADDNFGYALARVGLPEDARAEVLVGAPFHTELTVIPNASASGRAYLWPRNSSATSAGSLDILVNEPIMPGTQPDDWFGLGVSSAGDFDGDGLVDYAVGAPNGNNRSLATSGFVVLYDSQGLAVPAFLKSWKAAWAGSDEIGLVRLQFAFSLPAASYRHVDLDRTVHRPDGSTATERVWSGAPSLAAPSEPGVLGLDGSGFRFLDSGPDAGLSEGSRLTYRVEVLDADGSRFSLASLAGPAGAPQTGFGVALALDPAWPNPANPAVTVRFRASPRDNVTLRILDLRGRLVHELYRGPGSGDWQHEVWNGQAAGGVAAASGLYLIQLEDGRQSLTRRVVLAR